MAIIGQVRRMIRLEALKKVHRKAFLERTRVQKIPVKWDTKGRPIEFKEITHFKPEVA